MLAQGSALSRPIVHLHLGRRHLSQGSGPVIRLGDGLRRIEGARNVGAHKTSMLQDVEAGRALEVEALVGAVMELGQLTNTPCPHIEAVYACVKLFDRTMAKEGARIAVEKIAVDKAA